MKWVSRRSLVRWTAKGLYHSGLILPVSRSVGFGRRQPGYQVLIYHRVNDQIDPFFASVPTPAFDGHMAFVARAYRVLTIEELVDRARHGTLPRNALAITFDDGYRDNLTHAAPVLARHGLSATLFLATGFIGTGRAPWFDQLAWSLKTTPSSALPTPWGETLPLTTQAERVRALQRTLSYLKQVSDDELHRCFDAMLETLSVTDHTGLSNLMLTWEDVQALTNLGFAIGAHTMNHPILSRVSAQRAWTEIVGSRTMIESACGRPPLAFAYPNGGPDDYTQTTKHLVREAGFTCAVSTRFGVNTMRTSPWELRRGGPWERDLPTFALKLAAHRLQRN